MVMNERNIKIWIQDRMNWNIIETSYLDSYLPRSLAICRQFTADLKSS